MLALLQSLLIYTMTLKALMPGEVSAFLQFESEGSFQEVTRRGLPEFRMTIQERPNDSLSILPPFIDQEKEEDSDHAVVAPVDRNLGAGGGIKNGTGNLTDHGGNSGRGDFGTKKVLRFVFLDGHPVTLG